MEEKEEKPIDIKLNISIKSNTENNVSLYLDKEIIPIVNQLIEIGYEKLYSKRLVAYYHPKTIDEALNYFLKENGFIQHFFIEDQKIKTDKLCFLCGDKKENHLGYIPDIMNNINNEENNNILNSNDILNDIINVEDNNIEKNLIALKKENNLIDSFSIKKEEWKNVDIHFVIIVGIILCQLKLKKIN